MTFYDGEPMDKRECDITAERMEHDVALLRDGARILPPGILRLSDVQLEIALARIDPLYVPFPSVEIEESNEKTPWEQWLANDVGDLIRATEDKSFMQKARVFQRVGVPTVRDLLVMGKDMISKVPYMGEKNFAKLEAVLNDNEFGITWQATPTMQDITDICSQLSEVNACVLDKNFGSRHSKLHFEHPTSINDVVQAGPSPKDGQRFVSSSEPHTLARQSFDLYQAARLFAVRFEVARAGTIAIDWMSQFRLYSEES